MWNINAVYKENITEEERLKLEEKLNEVKGLVVNPINGRFFLSVTIEYLHFEDYVGYLNLIVKSVIGRAPHMIQFEAIYHS